MHLRLNKNSQVYRLWAKARGEAELSTQLSSTAVLILGYLEDHGEAYQIQVANEADINQGNLSSRHMPNLIKMGMVTYREVERLHLRRPNDRSKIYRITDLGRKVLELLSAYDNGDTLERVLSSSPYFDRKARSTRATSNLSSTGY